MRQISGLTIRPRGIAVVSWMIASSVSAVSVANAQEVLWKWLDDYLVGTPGERDPLGNRVGSVTAFAGHGLYCHADPRDPATGDTVTVSVSRGLAGSPAGIFAVQWNGASLFLPLFLGGMDARGVLSRSGTVPPGLAGNVAALQGIAITDLGLRASMEETVVLQ